MKRVSATLSATLREAVCHVGVYYLGVAGFASEFLSTSLQES